MNNLTVAYIITQNRSAKADVGSRTGGKIKPAHQNRCAGLLETLFERRTAYYPSQRSVRNVTESVRLLVPFVIFTVAVTFASSG
jgi:hypothetical protein